MAVAHVQTVSANDGDGGTTATGPSITTTAGNLLIGVLYGFDPGAGNPTCSAASWNSVAGTQAITKQAASTDSRIYIFYWENVAAFTGAATFTVSANAGWSIFLTEVSGAATSSSLDGAGASAASTSTTPASGNFTAAASDSWWHAAFGAEISTGSITVGSGWTIPTNGTLQTTSGTGSPREAGVEYRANPGSTGPFTGDFTISSAAWAAAVVVFKVASGGGGSTWGPLLGLQNNRLVQ